MQSLLYLHSTLIKYKVHGWFGGIFSSNEDLHSTLIKYKDTQYFYIFHYNLLIYIPLWLNIKQLQCVPIKLPIKIYIPLWLNIKKKKKGIIMKLERYLHSTLIKYKGQLQCVPIKFPIKIYIPLWLNIKQEKEVDKSNDNATFTFHSD